MNLILNEELLLHILETKNEIGVTNTASQFKRTRANLLIWVKRRGVRVVFRKGFKWLYKGVLY